MSKTKYTIIVLLLAVLALVLLWQPAPNDESQIAATSEFSDGFIFIGDHQIQFELADNAAEQAVGLSTKTGLESNQGMLFAFTEPNIPSFWMKNMQFPIDIIWIHQDRVVGVVSNVQPQPGVPDSELTTYFPETPVNFVLEVQAGWAEQNGLQIGQNVEVVRVVK